jgi:hypothetical protein
MTTNDSSKAQAQQTEAVKGLEMTLHTMPVPKASDTKTVASNGRLKLLLLAAVCVAPVVASYFTYYVIRPEGRRNNGELITPQRPLPQFSATTPDGVSKNLASLKGQWLLITVAGGACDAACQHNLYLQRQLRESLGKDSDRLDRVWLVSDAAPIPAALTPALKDAVVLRVASDVLAQWLPPAAGQAIDAHLYVVDPLGNLMMRFAPAMTIEQAGRSKRDLDRLLKASSFWDTAGRP